MDTLDVRTGLTQTQHDNGSSKRKSVSKVNGPQFTIPRLKKIKRDLLTDLTLDSHECQQEILAPIRKSFHFPFSASGHEFTRVQSVYNSELTGKYLEKRKEMKSSGYPDALLADNFAFIAIEHPSAVAKLCKDGIRCGNQQFSGLGVSHMAVHVCKHADVVTPMRPKCGERILLVVKVIKGKVKTVLCKNVGVQLEPTPNYDCHMAKPNVDQSALQAPHMLLYSTQLYLYEYGEFEIEEYPRQVLPYAVVYYTLKDPQAVSPKVSTGLPHQVPTSTLPPLPQGAIAQSPTSQSVTSAPQDTGPGNEVWRGRLHLRLTAGGQISIDVAMLSYFVPLTVTLISPIIIQGLYPEHNAQFTFFGGLTNIAHKDEVEWRAHYFKSFVMRPRPNNEEHFRALIKHVSAKREMPTVKLPNGVFLFLMPNCLLASQLGLVRRDDDSPVLHCVLMSNFSTNEAQKKKLLERKNPLKNFGSATSWENLFDDSDFSDEDSEDDNAKKIRRSLSRNLPPLFNEQRKIHNKFAAMSLADADINFAQCSCKKLSLSKAHQQHRRDDDVARVFTSIQAATLSSHKSKISHFPTASSSKPKQQVSRRAKAMPSFSPHGSDSETENGPGASSKHHDRFTLLDSTKTVEEELSEEELTNEQMEDIIFLRKPAITTSRPKSHLTRDKTVGHGDKSDAMSQAHLKYSSSSATKHGLKSSNPMPDFHKSSSEPVLSYKPKIIPTEPLTSIASKPLSKAKIIPVEPKIIPTEPVVETPDQVSSVVFSLPTAEVSLKKADVIPQSILKNRTTLAVKPENVKDETVMSLYVPVNEDFGDVDMRIPNQHPATLHPVFLSARQPPTLHHSPPQQQLSPNFDFGSWLTPAEIQASSSVKVEESSSFFRTPSPSSPISPPSESPPSPVDSPTSPPLDSPASPPPVLDTESPASPPLSLYVKNFRSSPIAIPTSRIYQNASPEVSHVHSGLYKARTIEELDNGQVFRSARTRTRSREGIDNADDMKDFLNSGFDSDLDSSYEDESGLQKANQVFDTVMFSHGHGLVSPTFPPTHWGKNSPVKTLKLSHSRTLSLGPERNVCTSCDLYTVCHKIQNYYLCMDCRMLKSRTSFYCLAVHSVKSLQLVNIKKEIYLGQNLDMIDLPKQTSNRGRLTPHWDSFHCRTSSALHNSNFQHHSKHNTTEPGVFSNVGHSDTEMTQACARIWTNPYKKILEEVDFEFSRLSQFFSSGSSNAQQDKQFPLQPIMLVCCKVSLDEPWMNKTNFPFSCEFAQNAVSTGLVPCIIVQPCPHPVHQVIDLTVMPCSIQHNSPSALPVYGQQLVCNVNTENISVGKTNQELKSTQTGPQRQKLVDENNIIHQHVPLNLDLATQVPPPVETPPGQTPLGLDFEWSNIVKASQLGNTQTQLGHRESCGNQRNQKTKEFQQSSISFEEQSKLGMPLSTDFRECHRKKGNSNPISLTSQRKEQSLQHKVPNDLYEVSTCKVNPIGLLHNFDKKSNSAKRLDSNFVKRMAPVEDKFTGITVVTGDQSVNCEQPMKASVPLYQPAGMDLYLVTLPQVAGAFRPVKVHQESHTWPAAVYEGTTIDESVSGQVDHQTHPCSYKLPTASFNLPFEPSTAVGSWGSGFREGDSIHLETKTDMDEDGESMGQNKVDKLNYCKGRKLAFECIQDSGETVDSSNNSFEREASESSPEKPWGSLADNSPLSDIIPLIHSDSHDVCQYIKGYNLLRNYFDNSCLANNCPLDIQDYPNVYNKSPVPKQESGIDGAIQVPAEISFRTLSKSQMELKQFDNYALKVSKDFKSGGQLLKSLDQWYKWQPCQNRQMELKVNQPPSVKMRKIRRQEHVKKTPRNQVAGSDFLSSLFGELSLMDVHVSKFTGPASHTLFKEPQLGTSCMKRLGDRFKKRSCQNIWEALALDLDYKLPKTQLDKISYSGLSCGGVDKAKWVSRNLENIQSRLSNSGVNTMSRPIPYCPYSKTSQFSSHSAGLQLVFPPNNLENQSVKSRFLGTEELTDGKNSTSKEAKISEEFCTVPVMSRVDSIPVIVQMFKEGLSPRKRQVPFRLHLPSYRAMAQLHCNSTGVRDLTSTVVNKQAVDIIRGNHKHTLEISSTSGQEISTEVIFESLSEDEMIPNLNKTVTSIFRSDGHISGPSPSQSSHKTSKGHSINKASKSSFLKFSCGQTMEKSQGCSIDKPLQNRFFDKSTQTESTDKPTPAKSSDKLSQAKSSDNLTQAKSSDNLTQAKSSDKTEVKSDKLTQAKSTNNLKQVKPSDKTEGKLTDKLTQAKSCNKPKQAKSTDKLTQAKFTGNLTQAKSNDKTETKSSDKLSQAKSADSLTQANFTDMLTQENSCDNRTQAKSTDNLIKAKSTENLTQAKSHAVLTLAKSGENLSQAKSCDKLTQANSGKKPTIAKSAGNSSHVNSDKLSQGKSADKLSHKKSVDKTSQAKFTDNPSHEKPVKSTYGTCDKLCYEISNKPFSYTNYTETLLLEKKSTHQLSHEKCNDHQPSQAKFTDYSFDGMVTDKSSHGNSDISHEKSKKLLHGKYTDKPSHHKYTDELSPGKSTNEVLNQQDVLCACAPVFNHKQVQISSPKIAPILIQTSSPKSTHIPLQTFSPKSTHIPLQNDRPNLTWRTLTNAALQTHPCLASLTPQKSIEFHEAFTPQFSSRAGSSQESLIKEPGTSSPKIQSCYLKLVDVRQREVEDIESEYHVVLTPGTQAILNAGQEKLNFRLSNVLKTSLPVVTSYNPLDVCGITAGVSVDRSSRLMEVERNLLACQQKLTLSNSESQDLKTAKLNKKRHYHPHNEHESTTKKIHLQTEHGSSAETKSKKKKETILVDKSTEGIQIVTYSEYWQSYGKKSEISIMGKQLKPHKRRHEGHHKASHTGIGTKELIKIKETDIKVDGQFSSTKEVIKNKENTSSGKDKFLHKSGRKTSLVDIKNINSTTEKQWKTKEKKVENAISSTIYEQRGHNNIDEREMNKHHLPHDKENNHSSCEKEKKDVIHIKQIPQSSKEKNSIKKRDHRFLKEEDSSKDRNYHLSTEKDSSKERDHSSAKKKDSIKERDHNLLKKEDSSKDRDHQSSKECRKERDLQSSKVKDSKKRDHMSSNEKDSIKGKGHRSSKDTDCRKERDHKSSKEKDSSKESDQQFIEVKDNSKEMDHRSSKENNTNYMDHMSNNIKESSKEREHKSSKEKDTIKVRFQHLLEEKDSKEWDCQSSKQKDNSKERCHQSPKEKDSSSESDQQLLKEEDKSMDRDCQSSNVNDDSRKDRDHQFMKEMDSSQERDTQPSKENYSSNKRDHQSSKEKDGRKERKHTSSNKKDSGKEMDLQSSIENDSSKEKDLQLPKENDSCKVRDHHSSKGKHNSKERDHNSSKEKDDSSKERDHQSSKEKDSSMKRVRQSSQERYSRKERKNKTSNKQEHQSSKENDISMERHLQSSKEEDVCKESVHQLLKEVDGSNERDHQLLKKEGGCKDRDYQPIEKDSSKGMDLQSSIEKVSSKERHLQSSKEEDGSKGMDLLLKEEHISIDRDHQSSKEKDCSKKRNHQSSKKKDSSVNTIHRSSQEKDSSKDRGQHSSKEKDNRKESDLQLFKEKDSIKEKDLQSPLEEYSGKESYHQSSQEKDDSSKERDHQSTKEKGSGKERKHRTSNKKDCIKKSNHQSSKEKDSGKEKDPQLSKENGCSKDKDYQSSKEKDNKKERDLQLSKEKDSSKERYLQSFKEKDSVKEKGKLSKEKCPRKKTDHHSSKEKYSSKERDPHLLKEEVSTKKRDHQLMKEKNSIKKRNNSSKEKDCRKERDQESSKEKDSRKERYHHFLNENEICKKVEQNRSSVGKTNSISEEMIQNIAHRVPHICNKENTQNEACLPSQKKKTVLLVLPAKENRVNKRKHPQISESEHGVKLQHVTVNKDKCLPETKEKSNQLAIYNYLHSWKEINYLNVEPSPNTEQGHTSRLNSEQGHASNQNTEQGSNSSTSTKSEHDFVYSTDISKLWFSHEKNRKVDRNNELWRTESENVTYHGNNFSHDSVKGLNSNLILEQGLDSSHNTEQGNNSSYPTKSENDFVYCTDITKLWFSSCGKGRNIDGNNIPGRIASKSAQETCLNRLHSNLERNRENRSFLNVFKSYDSQVCLSCFTQQGIPHESKDQYLCTEQGHSNIEPIQISASPCNGANKSTMRSLQPVNDKDELFKACTVAKTSGLSGFSPGYYDQNNVSLLKSSTYTISPCVLDSVTDRSSMLLNLSLKTNGKVSPLKLQTGAHLVSPLKSSMDSDSLFKPLSQTDIVSPFIISPFGTDIISPLRSPTGADTVSLLISPTGTDEISLLGPSTETETISLLTSTKTGAVSTLKSLTETDVISTKKSTDPNTVSPMESPIMKLSWLKSSLDPVSPSKVSNGTDKIALLKLSTYFDTVSPLDSAMDTISSIMLPVDSVISTTSSSHIDKSSPIKSSMDTVPPLTSFTDADTICLLPLLAASVPPSHLTTATTSIAAATATSIDAVSPLSKSPQGIALALKLSTVGNIVSQQRPSVNAVSQSISFTNTVPLMKSLTDTFMTLNSASTGDIENPKTDTTQPYKESSNFSVYGGSLLCSATVMLAKSSDKPLQLTYDKPLQSKCDSPLILTYDNPLKSTCENSLESTYNSLKSICDNSLQSTYDNHLQSTYITPIQSTCDKPLKSTDEKPLQSTCDNSLQSTYDVPIQSTYDNPQQSTRVNSLQSACENPLQPAWDNHVTVVSTIDNVLSKNDHTEANKTHSISFKIKSKNLLDVCGNMKKLISKTSGDVTLDTVLKTTQSKSLNSKTREPSTKVVSSTRYVPIPEIQQEKQAIFSEHVTQTRKVPKDGLQEKKQPYLCEDVSSKKHVTKGGLQEKKQPYLYEDVSSIKHVTKVKIQEKEQPTCSEDVSSTRDFSKAGTQEKQQNVCHNKHSDSGQGLSAETLVTSCENVFDRLEEKKEVISPQSPTMVKADRCSVPAEEHSDRKSQKSSKQTQEDALDLDSFPHRGFTRNSDKMRIKKTPDRTWEKCRSKSSKDSSHKDDERHFRPERGRRVEQVEESRKSRRAHPYLRADYKNNKDYADFNLAYKDLEELLQCLTVASFQARQRSALDVPKAGSRPGHRFAHYRFKRSAVSRDEPDRNTNELIRKEDIRDYDRRCRLADLVEELAERERNQAKLEDEVIFISDTDEEPSTDIAVQPLHTNFSCKDEYEINRDLFHTYPEQDHELEKLQSNKECLGTGSQESVSKPGTSESQFPSLMSVVLPCGSVSLKVLPSIPASDELKSNSGIPPDVLTVNLDPTYFPTKPLPFKDVKNSHILSVSSKNQNTEPGRTAYQRDLEKQSAPKEPASDNLYPITASGCSTVCQETGQRVSGEILDLQQSEVGLPSLKENHRKTATQDTFLRAEVENEEPSSQQSSLLSLEREKMLKSFNKCLELQKKKKKWMWPPGSIVFDSKEIEYKCDPTLEKKSYKLLAYFTDSRRDPRLLPDDKKTAVKQFRKRLHGTAPETIPTEPWQFSKRNTSQKDQERNHSKCKVVIGSVACGQRPVCDKLTSISYPHVSNMPSHQGNAGKPYFEQRSIYGRESTKGREDMLDSHVSSSSSEDKFAALSRCKDVSVTFQQQIPAGTGQSHMQSTQLVACVSDLCQEITSRDRMAGDTPTCTAQSSSQRLLKKSDNFMNKTSQTQLTNGQRTNSYKPLGFKSSPLGKSIKHFPGCVFNYRYKNGRWHHPFPYSKSPKWLTPKARVQPLRKRKIDRDLFSTQSSPCSRSSSSSCHTSQGSSSSRHTSSQGSSSNRHTSSQGSTSSCCTLSQSSTSIDYNNQTKKPCPSVHNQTTARTERPGKELCHRSKAKTEQDRRPQGLPEGTRKVKKRHSPESDLKANSALQNGQNKIAAMQPGLHLDSDIHHESEVLQKNSAGQEREGEPITCKRPKTK